MNSQSKQENRIREIALWIVEAHNGTMDPARALSEKDLRSLKPEDVQPIRIYLRDQYRFLLNKCSEKLTQLKPWIATEPNTLIIGPDERLRFHASMIQSLSISYTEDRDGQPFEMLWKRGPPAAIPLQSWWAELELLTFIEMTTIAKYDTARYENIRLRMSFCVSDDDKREYTMKLTDLPHGACIRLECEKWIVSLWITELHRLV